MKYCSWIVLLLALVQSSYGSRSSCHKRYYKPFKSSSADYYNDDITVGVMCNAQLFGISCRDLKTLTHVAIGIYNKYSECCSFRLVNEETSTPQREVMANVIITPQLGRAAIYVDGSMGDEDSAYPWGVSSLNVRTRYLGANRTLYTIHMGAHRDLFINWNEELLKTIISNILYMEEDCAETTSIGVTQEDLGLLPKNEDVTDLMMRMFTSYALLNWNNLKHFNSRHMRLYTTTELFSWTPLQSFANNLNVPIPRRVSGDIVLAIPGDPFMRLLTIRNNGTCYFEAEFLKIVHITSVINDRSSRSDRWWNEFVDTDYYNMQMQRYYKDFFKPYGVDNVEVHFTIGNILYKYKIWNGGKVIVEYTDDAGTHMDDIDTFIINVCNLETDDTFQHILAATEYHVNKKHPISDMMTSIFHIHK